MERRLRLLPGRIHKSIDASRIESTHPFCISPALEGIIKRPSRGRGRYYNQKQTQPKRNKQKRLPANDPFRIAGVQ
ncbi:hypothetical protein HNY73_011920 [Argiope bruennichi]|uniref:Uncharacterized protein n=1 Tax=Argiope bruennichi TaxID=94029 RepID=A0A8T0EYX3_ARGBR|nr:hypothetical protein HNY73_011920 [Argiope bruennichi]